MKKIGSVVLIYLAAWHSANAFEHFITRQGNRLYDGEQEFRFMGANMPGLVLPYDWTLFLTERLHLPTPWEQEDAFKTLDQMNLRVVRTWNLPIRDPKEKPQSWHYVLGPGQFNEEAFKCVDHLFALANKYNVRVILDLTAESGDYLGGIGTYAAHRGKNRAAFYTDPQLKEDYKATVRHVVNRYRDEKAILAWQFGNEMHSAPDAWLSEMAAYIKSLDPNHLVAETRHRPGQPLLVDPNVDLVTRHLYSNYGGVGGGWPDAIRKELEKLRSGTASRSAGGRPDGEIGTGSRSAPTVRPLFIGEFGPYIDGKMFTHNNVVARLREFLDYVQSEPAMPGALIWSMYFHHQNGGFYWHQIMTYPTVWSYHWPGFPSADAQREIGIMTAMREAAFKIQGLPVSPVPVPDAPELLPIGDTPLLTWRGSAGATGYDIERGEPWSVIATNVCDADVAYRPLFSDTTARPGHSYYYRVIARNASGTSKPSNVIGPVAVKRVCLVDELQDFSRVTARSDSLKLNNDYNALYAEFLFRAKGSTNDWVAYKVPSTIESVRIVAFCVTGQIADLTFLISRDGTKFTALQPNWHGHPAHGAGTTHGQDGRATGRTERPLASPPGGAAGGQKRTLLEYECAVPPGHKQLKILWSGFAELDRVEIYHSGR